MEDIDHEYTDEVVCPYCGNELSDSWELARDGAYDCGECEKTFRYTRNVSVDYSTGKLPCANNEGLHHWWSQSFLDHEGQMILPGHYHCSLCGKSTVFEGEVRPRFNADDNGK